MRIKKLVNILLCTVLIINILPISPYAESTDSSIELSEEDYVEGEIIITTSSELIDSSVSFVTAGADDYTMIDFEEKEIENIEEIDTFNETSDERTYVLKFEGDVLEKCKEIEKLPGVVCAEPNLLLHTMGFTMPSEVKYGSMYAQHMKWYFDLMSIPDTWQEYETTGEDIVIAVIDNGFKIDASDFPTNLWTDANGNHGWNTYKNSADISPIYKSDGTTFSNTAHGTHVAGVIGGKANGSNIIGAAYNAKLMLINAAKYISDTKIPQFDVADIIEAIDYARNNGADIINLSLGAHATAIQLENAVNRAYNAGIAVIAAAGNEGISTTNSKVIPASYQNVIGVMAIDKTDTTQLASFSNYDPTGIYYDVAAPGYQILSCSIESGKLMYMSGTSQACPLVTSCAALYLSIYPDATVSELYEAIRTSPTTQVTSNTETVTDATYYFKSLNALELLNDRKIEPIILFDLSTGVTKDPTRDYIYGLNEGYNNLLDYLSVQEGTGYSEIIETENGNGTGTVFNVYDNYGDLYISYYVIIFGDTNGDAYADGQDAVVTSCIIDSPDSFPEYLHFAADVDFNDTITEDDYHITAKYAIGLDYIIQLR